MFADATAVFVLLVSFGLTFVLSRWLGKRWQARRDAQRSQEAARALARQSRQVRRAAERQKKG